MMQAYYDISRKDKFQDYFGHLWVGVHPTPLQGKFQVLFFDEALIPSYLERSARESNFYITSFVKDLMKGNIESCMVRTQAFFASIPNDLDTKTEKHYQTIFYLIFKLMGQYIDTEVKSAIGRADVVVKLQDTIYVFEFKIDGTADEALAQII